MQVKEQELCICRQARLGLALVLHITSYVARVLTSVFSSEKMGKQQVSGATKSK